MRITNPLLQFSDWYSAVTLDARTIPLDWSAGAKGQPALPYLEALHLAKAERRGPFTVLPSVGSWHSRNMMDETMFHRVQGGSIDGAPLGLGQGLRVSNYVPGNVVSNYNHVYAPRLWDPLWEIGWAIQQENVDRLQTIAYTEAEAAPAYLEMPWLRRQRPFEVGLLPFAQEAGYVGIPPLEMLTQPYRYSFGIPAAMMLANKRILDRVFCYVYPDFKDHFTDYADRGGAIDIMQVRYGGPGGGTNVPLATVLANMQSTPFTAYPPVFDKMVDARIGIVGEIAADGWTWGEWSVREKRLQVEGLLHAFALDPDYRMYVRLYGALQGVGITAQSSTRVALNWPSGTSPGQVMLVAEGEVGDGVGDLTYNGALEAAGLFDPSVYAFVNPAVPGNAIDDTVYRFNLGFNILWMTVDYSVPGGFIMLDRDGSGS